MASHMAVITRRWDQCFDLNFNPNRHIFSSHMAAIYGTWYFFQKPTWHMAAMCHIWHMAAMTWPGFLTMHYRTFENQNKPEIEYYNNLIGSVLF